MRGWGGVIKCKNPKFLEGKHVVYHMKGLDEKVSCFIFLVPMGWDGGHQVQKFKTTIR